MAETRRNTDRQHVGDSVNSWEGTQEEPKYRPLGERRRNHHQSFAIQQSAPPKTKGKASPPTASSTISSHNTARRYWLTQDSYIFIRQFFFLNSQYGFQIKYKLGYHSLIVAKNVKTFFLRLPNLLIASNIPSLHAHCS